MTNLAFERVLIKLQQFLSVQSLNYVLRGGREKLLGKSTGKPTQPEATKDVQEARTKEITNDYTAFRLDLRWHNKVRNGAAVSQAKQRLLVRVYYEQQNAGSSAILR